MQVFVIQAIEQYAREVAAKNPDDLHTGIVSSKAWHNCALEAIGQLESQYNKQETA